MSLTSRYYGFSFYLYHVAVVVIVKKTTHENKASVCFNIVQNKICLSYLAISCKL